MSLNSLDDDMIEHFGYCYYIYCSTLLVTENYNFIPADVLNYNLPYFIEMPCYLFLKTLLHTLLARIPNCGDGPLPEISNF